MAIYLAWPFSLQERLPSASLITYGLLKYINLYSFTSKKSITFQVIRKDIVKFQDFVGFTRSESLIPLPIFFLQWKPAYHVKK